MLKRLAFLFLPTTLFFIALSPVWGSGNLTESGGCNVPSVTYATIQSAIDDMSCDDIQINAGTFQENIQIDRNVNIQGAGQALTIIDGDQQNTVVTISNNSEINISDLSITNGRSNPSCQSGGIVNAGNLSLTRIELSDNLGAFSGGMLNLGHVNILSSTIQNNSVDFLDSCEALVGGILNRGVLTMTNSSMNNNTSNSVVGGFLNNEQAIASFHDTIFQGNIGAGGGAIHNSLSAQLGIHNSQIISNTGTSLSNNGSRPAIYSWGPATIVNSFIGYNSGQAGSYTVEFFQGDFHIENSTIAYNDVPGILLRAQGGEVIIKNSAIHHNDGVGLYQDTGLNTHLINTTISYNTAEGEGAGIRLNNGIINLLNATIVGNQSTMISDNIFVSSFADELNMQNTVIQEGADFNCAGDLDKFFSDGNNMSDDATCALLEPTDFENTDADLMPLADYGGPTWTHALNNSSLAIDAGNDVNCPATDQRGITRPQGDHCDIGSYEVEQVAIMATIAYSNTTATITWTTDPNECDYTIYRSTSPYTGFVWVAEVTDANSYDFIGDIGDVNVNYYYYVEAVCTDGLGIANVVGEFDFAIAPSS